MRALLLIPLIGGFLFRQDAEALLKSARERHARKEFVAAVIEYTRALAVEPMLVEALVGRGGARRDLQDFDGALADLTAALSIDPRNVEAYVHRGNCRADRQDYAGALGDLDRAIELGADAPVVYALRGISRTALERYAEALPDLDRAMAGGHRSPQAFASRAWARLNRMDFRGAVSDATRSLQHQSRSVRALSIRGLAYIGLGSWDNALRDFKERIEISGSRSVPDSLWMFLVRSRLGEKDAAAKDLREARAALAPGAGTAWAGALMDFLLGDGSEADLLKAAREAGAEEGRTLDAHLYIGYRRLLQSREAEAAGSFELAAGEGEARIDFERLAARAERDRLRYERRKIVLDELEEKFRALKPFRADFGATGLSGGKDGKAVSTFEVFYDRAGGRVLVSLRGREKETGRDWEGHVAAEDMVFFAWGLLDRAVKMDGRPFIRGLEQWDQELRAELDRVLPKGQERREEPAPPELILLLDLQAKASKEDEGTFRFSVGRAGSPAGWLREARKPTGCVMTEKEGEVQFHYPAARKTAIVDRATGFLRSLRVEDFDGTVREVRMTGFRPIEGIPDVPRPGKWETLPVDFAQLSARWKEQIGWLERVVGGAVDRWERMAREGNRREVQVLVTRWAARYADSLRTYALRNLARSYVRRQLDQGTRLAELGSGEGLRGFAEACRGQAAEIDQFVRLRLEETAGEMETRAIEAPIDSRRHGLLGELLTASFEFKLVEAERGKEYGDRTESVFREELEAQKQL